MEKKLQKQYLTGCTLLIMQNLWQVNSQVLLIILLQGFIKFNVRMDSMIKNVKLVELNTKIEIAFLNTQTLTLKMI